MIKLTTNIQNPYYDARIDQLKTPSDVFNYLLKERFRYQKAQLDLLPPEIRQNLYEALCEEDEVLRQKIQSLP